jgi:hypothetical protein
MCRCADNCFCLFTMKDVDALHDASGIVRRLAVMAFCLIRAEQGGINQER